MRDLRSVALGYVAGIALGGAAVVTAAAYSADDPPTMTRYEWTAVQRAEAITRIEARCECSYYWFGPGAGTRWTGHDGHAHKIAAFDGPDGYHGIVWVRKWTDGTWHASHEKQWWNNGATPVDQVIWKGPRHP